MNIKFSNVYLQLVALRIYLFSEISTFEDLLQFVERDYLNQRYYCTICTHFSHKWKANVKNHVESKHYNGQFVHTCADCGDTFNNRNTMQRHRSQVHINNKGYQF